MAGWEHGTMNGYSNRKCRCALCRAANAAYNARRKAERYEQTRQFGLLGGVEHGKASSYTNWGCRCPACTTANTATSARRRKQAAKEVTAS